MRESLAKALSNPVSLAEGVNERPVDIVHAIASAQIVRIGEAPTRYNLSAIGRKVYPAMSLPKDDGGLNAAILDAAGALSAALMARGHRLGLLPSTARLVAFHAIRESRDATCRTCKGRIDTQTGRTAIPDVERLKNWHEGDGPVPMKPCPSCGGSGKHRFSDDERAEAIGEVHKNMARAFSVAHSIISAALITLDLRTTELRREG